MDAPLSSSTEHRAESAVPARAGAGLKSEHIEDILSDSAPVGFFEFHAENYMGDGGAPHRQLEAIRSEYPVSMHGVGLSIGGAGALDKEHLQRLCDLNQRYQPGLFSEHLAWSTHDNVFFNDLLPVAYNGETLSRVCDHIDEVQETVGRQMLLENPSTYIAYQYSTMSETDFLKTVVQKTGCGLLLDVNNVHVSCTNHEWSADAYLNAFPVNAVKEIHLGGHAPDVDDAGRPLLIDAHDREVDDVVWALYEQVINRTGPLPTVIEWDNDVPKWSVLLSEVNAADRLLVSVGQRFLQQVG